MNVPLRRGRFGVILWAWNEFFSWVVFSLSRLSPSRVVSLALRTKMEVRPNRVCMTSQEGALLFFLRKVKGERERVGEVLTMLLESGKGRKPMVQEVSVGLKNAVDPAVCVQRNWPV